MINRFILLLLSVVAVLPSLHATVKPASLISDGMVLQQKAKVRLWGWAAPNQSITAQGSWNGKVVKAQSDANGRWELQLETPNGSFQPYELTLSDGQPLVIRDVLIGEVWLSAGQSNMEMPLSGWPNCPVSNSAELIQSAQELHNKFHFVQVAQAATMTPSDTLSLKWENCDSITAKHFGAVSFAFGKQLLNKLNCPIGIINSSYSGSRIEAWLPKSVIETYPDEASLLDKLEEYIPTARPTVIYNGMIHPLEGYTLRGFLWYQGEANVASYFKYADRLRDLIKTWRKLWRQSDAPFYYVEITPFRYGGLAKNRGPRLREIQWEVSREMNNTGIICTNDLVSPDEQHQIHPSRKFEVGQRLSWLALQKVYGIAEGAINYPEFQKVKFANSEAILTFKNAEQGFNRTQEIEGFEICSSDNIYHPATARIEGSSVIVSSAEVAHPKVVRYAYNDFQLGNLKNKEGLPVVPFRSNSQSEKKK